MGDTGAASAANTSTLQSSTDDTSALVQRMIEYAEAHQSFAATGSPTFPIDLHSARLFFNASREKSLKITHIMIFMQIIGDEAMDSLGGFIQTSSSLIQLALIGSGITDKGIDILSHYLSNNKTLRSINISQNLGITDRSLLPLSQLVEATLIEDVLTSNTSITAWPKLFIPLVKNIIKNGTQLIETGERGLADDEMIQLSELFMKQGCNIIEIELDRLWKNNITSKGCEALFQALMKCGAIAAWISFSGNNIDDLCAPSLCEYISANEEIYHIDLCHNNISNKTIIMLSDYMIGNTTMKTLIFAENRQITEESVPYLLSIIHNSCIERLDIHGTGISTDGYIKIKNALDVPKQERMIPIRSTTKSASKLR